ncbi:MAG TPA: EscU/YscU/HrcU family type III secretion system export apparatus switch protein [Terriglobales bacterium]|jgi:flagellar biosynthetic protein FlhB|nr:EscU/YscU/HrcU family type III secretion system export apparatus switch protein [Terriglobales bacterium]
MAEDLGHSRTEAPTPRRREEARAQGRVVVSIELTAGLLLWAAVGVLWVRSHDMGANLLEAVRYGILCSFVRDLGPQQIRDLLTSFLMRGLQTVEVLFALLFVIALAGMVGQAGFRVLPVLAAPNWERVDPAAGLGRMFSLPALLRGGTATAKAALTLVLAVWLMKGRFARLAAFHQQGLPSTVAQTWDMVLLLGVVVAAAFTLIGAVDYMWQRLRFEATLRMTREELKEEIKREEGDPHIKLRIRKLARELSQRRMVRDVPRATVVITNPIHLAIALRYEKGTLGAPRVVAKGAGYVARRIVETARRHGVPVVERKPVAQALYKAVQVGQEIPAALYQAIAEVLAYVYRLRGLA